MTMLRLEISNEANLEKIMEVLRQFENDGLAVIEESDYFTRTRKKVEKDLEEALKPGAKTHSIEEAREYIKGRIKKYEDSTR